MRPLAVVIALAVASSLVTGCSSPAGSSTDRPDKTVESVPKKLPSPSSGDRTSKFAGKTEIFLQHADNTYDPKLYKRAKMDGEPSDIRFFKPRKDEGVRPRDYADYDRKTFKFLALPTNVIPPQSYYMLQKGGLDKALAPTGYKAVELLDSGHVKILPNLYLGYYDFAWIPLNVLTEYWSGNESMNQELWSAGNDYVVIANSFNGGVSVIAPPGLKSVKDLAGKKVGIMNPSFNMEALLNKKLKTVGLATESAGGNVGIEMGAPGGVMNDLMDDKIAAVMAWGSYEKTLREKFKYKELIGWKDMGYGAAVPYQVLVVRRDILEKHPDIVQIVVQQNYDATQRAIQVGDYKEPEYARVERYWKDDMGSPRKIANIRVDELVRLDADVNVAFLKDVHDYMTRYGYFKIPYTFDELVDQRFQKSVDR